MALPMCTLYTGERQGLVSMVRSQWRRHRTPWLCSVGLIELHLLLQVPLFQGTPQIAGLGSGPLWCPHHVWCQRLWGNLCRLVRLLLPLPPTPGCCVYFLTHFPSSIAQVPAQVRLASAAHAAFVNCLSLGGLHCLGWVIVHFWGHV